LLESHPEYELKRLRGKPRFAVETKI